MSGPLDDLDFSITIDLMGAPEQLRQVNASIENLGRVSSAVVPSTSALAASVRGIDFSSTTAGADSLYRVASAAGQTAEVMETVSTALDVVDTSITTLAISTETAAIASNTLGRTMRVVAGGARVSSGAFMSVGGALRTVSGGALHVAHTMHAAVIVGDLLKSAFDMLMVPIRAVWAVGVAAFTAIAFAVSTVLAPVKLLWSGMVMLAGFAFRLISPLLGVAMSVGKAWFAFRGWIGAIKVIGSWLSFLPPRLRIVAGGLLALGLSGKVGAAGLRVLSTGVAIAAGAARAAMNSFRLLYLPIQAIRNPAAAARTALGLLTSAATAAGSAAMSAAGKIYGLTQSVGRLAASPIRSAVDGFKSLGSTVMRLGPQLAAVGTMAAVAWGTKVAVATEKNVAVFGTMLKDMGQGAAVVKSLQGTQAAKLFDNQELLDSGRLLYKAGVSAKDVAGKTNQLATIAAATSTELGDLARIYQQGANTGSFGLDKINQLAERGIDIYHALEAATGKSGEALKTMISEGKIGITEMDAALAHLTEGNGIYAGSLETMANTTAGKMATLKNTVGQALGQVMGIALQVLAPFGTAMVTFSEQFSEAFTSFRGPIIYAATAVAWYFGNLITIAKFAWMSVGLFAIRAFNDMAYFFTVKIPAYLTWFGQNWKNIFIDAGNLVVTVFSNVATNIKNAMRAIWNYIKSGGTSELKFAFVPLLDGFKATVSELPDIPDRAMTELEKSLTDQTQQLGTTLADNFDKMLAENQAKITEATPELKDTASAVTGPTGADTAKKAANKAAENKAVGVRSEEGQNLIAQFAKVRESDTQKKAANAQIKTEQHLAKLQKDVERSKPIVGKAWAA